VNNGNNNGNAKQIRICVEESLLQRQNTNKINIQFTQMAQDQSMTVKKLEQTKIAKRIN